MQPSILPYFHTLILPYSHTSTLSYFHILILPYSHTSVFSYFHTLILLYSHTSVLSYFRTLILPCSHTSILSYFILSYFILSTFHTLSPCCRWSPSFWGRPWSSSVLCLRTRNGMLGTCLVSLPMMEASSASRFLATSIASRVSYCSFSFVVSLSCAFKFLRSCLSFSKSLLYVLH